MHWNINRILRKYLIMGSQNCERLPEEILLEAIDSGITAFQFREKGVGCLGEEEKLQLGLRLRAICKEHHIPFFINDDIYLADQLDVDGIHVGQDDMPADKLRRKYPDKMIGLSVSNDEEVKKSDLSSVDYLGAGPMFPTSSKLDAKPVAGIEWIKRLREQNIDLPIVGIGGINPDNADAVIRAGAQGVAVISAITSCENIKEVVKKL
ncbi:thiamine phosphate synthase [Jeotgalibacillus proteolyticus]|uniref:thiamine phosphate synthase n=1 Tax=Jeotgalibacillus proteolyticus TaxID=2082395 RepID=UPI003CFA50C8